MGRYLLIRGVHGVFVLFAVSLVVFMLSHLSGDPVRLFLSPEATAAEVQRVRNELGLTEPLYVQFWHYISHAVQADLGDSFVHQQSALGLVLARMPATLELTFAAALVAVLIAIPTGLLAATRRGTAVDGLMSSTALLGQSVPVFVVGLLLIYVFSVTLGWLPLGGRGGLEHLVMPALTLGAFSATLLMRVTRSEMIDTLQEHYILVARANGFGSRLIVTRYALKNAAIPIVTVFGLQFGALFSGAVVTETVFSYPGIGRLAVEAIFSRDFPVIQAFVLVAAFLVVVVNLLTDLALLYLDPRLRTG